MAQPMTLQIEIRADGSAAVKNLQQVGGAVNSLGAAGANANASLQDLTNTLLSTGVAGELLGRLGDRLGELAQLADDWNNLQARIRLVTESTTEYAQAMEDVLGIAQRTSSGVQDTAKLYVTLTKALKAAGDASTDVAALTETISQAMQVSGASTQEASAALQQLSQALASGVLRGDEFNSIMEQAPRLQQAIADSLGVTSGKLRQMAEQGMLTAETVISALNGQSAKIAAEYAQLPDTIGRATTRLQNEFAKLVGSFDDTTGASEKVAGAIGGIAAHLDDLAGLAAASGLAAMAVAAGKAASAMAGYAASARTAAEETQSAAAMERDAALVSAEAAANRTRIAAQMADQNAKIAMSAREAAIASENAARQQLLDLKELSIYGEQRAAAERRLEAAILARAEAESKASAAGLIAVNTARAAAETSAILADRQTTAAASMGLWGTAAAGLRSALSLLRDPFNAIMAASVAMMGYELGKHLRDWGLGALEAAKDGTLAAQAFELLATEAEKAQASLDRSKEKIKSQLAEIAKATGLPIKSMEEFNKLVETGAVVFDETTGKWQRGVVAIDVVGQSLSKLDALYKTQLSTLEKVAKQVDANNQLQEQRNALAIKTAEVLGSEKDKLTAIADARQKDAAGIKSLLSVQEAQYQVALKDLDVLEKQAAALKGPLPEAIAASLAKQKELVAEKQRSVDATKIQLQTSELEITQSKIATETYGNQAAEVGRLSGTVAALTDKLERQRVTQKAGADAAAQMQTAYAVATEAMRRYQEALQQGSEDADALWQAAEKAAAQINVLKDKVAAGEQAEKDAAVTRRQLAVETKKYEDALSDAVAATERELKAAEQQTAQLDRQSAVRQSQLSALAEESRTRAKIAELLGNETEAARLNAEAMATESQAKQEAVDAAWQHADALNTEVEKAQAATDALYAQANADDYLSDAELNAIATAKENVAAKQAEADAAAQAAEHLAQQTEAEQALADAQAQAANTAAEAAAQRAEAEQEAAEQTAKAQREATQYTDLVRSALVDLADQYAYLGDVAYRSWLKSAEATAVAWREWRDGRINDYLQSVREHLEAIGRTQSSVDSLIGKLNDGTFSAQELAKAAGLAQGNVSILGNERLETLQDAIDSAKEKMDDLRDSAKDALETALDVYEQAGLGSTELEREQIAWAQTLSDLQDQLAEAKAKGDAQAIADLERAIELQRKAHEARMKQIQDEEAAAKKAAEAGGGVVSGSGGDIGFGGGNQVSGGGGTGGNASMMGTSTGIGTKSSGTGSGLGGQSVSKVVEVKLSSGDQTVSLFTDEALTDKVLRVLEQAKARS